MLQKPESTFGLSKGKLLIMMTDDATRHDRLLLQNTVLSVVEGSPSLIVFDSKSFFEDMRYKMIVVELLNFVSSAICFSLGAFMLITTISANIKDSMWELGVLRSMGSTKEQITRILCYEMISNTLSAMSLGYTSGILVSILAIAQFHVLV